MSSSRQLSKNKNANFFAGNDPRMLQPFTRGFTDAEKIVLGFLSLPVDWAEAEMYFRRLPDSWRSYFPERGDPSRAEQGESSSSIIRYDNNFLEVECGQGSMQYYRRDPDGTVSVINVRINSKFELGNYNLFRWLLLMMMNHMKWSTIQVTGR